MAKATEILKRHVWCIIIFAVILLISGAIIAYKTQEAALGLTASIVSIVLAVVVIFYTFYHSERSSRLAEQSQNNMLATKDAISEILHTTANTEALVRQQTQSPHVTNEDTALMGGNKIDSNNLYTSPEIAKREAIIREAINGNSDSEKIKLLINSCAITGLNCTFERVYGTIYGSQVLLLEMLDQKRAGIDNNSVKQLYYDPAATAYIAFYNNYGYDSYMDFLKTFELITYVDDKWKITDCGVDFMEFLKTSDLLVRGRQKQG